MTAAVVMTGLLVATGPAAAAPMLTMSSAAMVAAETPAADGAVSWARAQLGSAAWDGECLQFVSDAYAQAGVSLAAEADSTYSAIDFWNSYHGTKYLPADTTDSEDPPVGALVFWGPTSTNPYGHVAISSGSTAAISSEERTNVGVHEFSIPDRDANFEGQLGYILPG